jgi:conjugal transfer mating pair stabilization protein TraG
MFEIYAYGNVDTLTGVFNAIAAIMGGADYFGLIKTVAITGVLVAAFAGLFTPGRFAGWGWFIGFMLVYNAMFLPKVDVVVVDKLGSQPPVAVGNVPIGVAFFGHYTSRVGDVMTRFFETAFQVIPDTNAQLPAELAYQKNGVMFGNRLIQASRAATIGDPQLRTDLIAYVYNCTVYDLQDGTIDPAAFAQSTDIWSLMGNPNPARFSTWGTPVQVDTCPNVYTQLANRLPAEIASARALLAFQLNPSMDPALAPGVIDGQIEQAYTKTKIAVAAQGAADLLRQNIMINLVQDTNSLAGLKLNDPAATMLATARANATASTNASFLTMGRIAAEALPMVRNVIEAVVYAVFPFVFLLFLLAQGRGLAMAIKSFVMSLVWIQLWPPLYAILNYVGTLASARNLAAAARMGSGAQGLTLDTAASIYQGAISDQAIAGYMVVSIPIIATAIIKGGEVAFQAVTATSAIQSAASSEAASATKGLVTQNAVSLDQQQLAPTRTSAFMASTTDARGTTIQGSGPDAGVFRYQATLSRLASTFTVTERQATALGESAREAESFATTQREAMQRSQATALTHALGIQDSYEKSQQRTGATSTSEGGSTNTQFQTLNSVAKDVNRRLGPERRLDRRKERCGIGFHRREDSAHRDRRRRQGGGPAVDQQTLQSAYDYARKAAESAQISDASALVKDFRSSDAYQWAAATAPAPPPATTRHRAKPANGNPPATAPMAVPRNWRAPRSSCANGAAAPRPTSPTTRPSDWPSAASCAKKTRSRCSGQWPRSRTRTPVAAAPPAATSPPTARSAPANHFPRPWAGRPHCATSTTAKSVVQTAARSPTRPIATTPTSEPVNPGRVCSRARRSETTSQAGSSRASGSSRRHREGAPSGVGGRWHAQRELQRHRARRQGQPEPRRQPGGLGHGRRQCRHARDRHPAQAHTHR